MAGKRVREVRVAWGHKSISGIDTEQGYCINSGQRDSAWSVDCLEDDLGKTRCNINDVLSTSLVFESLLKAGIRDKPTQGNETEWKLLVTSPQCLFRHAVP